MSVRVPWWWLLLLLTIPSCPEVNPNFVGTTGEGTSTATTTAATTVADSGSGGATGPIGTAGGSSGTTTPVATGGTTTSADTTASTGPATTGDPAELGFPCDEDSDCDQSIGAECCGASQCQDTCMVPCRESSDCPEDGMGCAHGYCLFRCDNDDDDCDMWPGYTCQHLGVLCEKD